MQHYIHHGLGFAGEHLTEDEAERLNNYSGNISLLSFTEDYESSGWATVVVKDCGEIGKGGKFCTWNDLKKLCSKEAIIDLPTKALILKELTKVGLAHHIDKVETIIFSYVA